jgi:aminopeptidase N
MRHEAEQYFASGGVERPVIALAVADPDSLLDANAYQKGAWVLHQLRGLIGDSAFVGALREYFRVHRHGTAVSADFALAASKVSGKDLEWYFGQSLTQPGYPVLDVRWEHRGDRVTIDIRQTQPPSWGTYRLPGLVLRIDGKDYPVDVSGRRTRHTLRGFDRAPTRIEVDPAGWWLLKAAVSSSEQ